MRYSDIAIELRGIANQITTLAEKLDKADSAVPYVNGIDDKKLANKITLTVSEAAEAISVSKTIMYQLIHREDFPCIQIGRRHLIPRDKLIEWINNHCGEDL